MNENNQIGHFDNKSNKMYASQKPKRNTHQSNFKWHYLGRLGLLLINVNVDFYISNIRFNHINIKLSIYLDLIFLELTLLPPPFDLCPQLLFIQGIKKK